MQQVNLFQDMHLFKNSVHTAFQSSGKVELVNSYSR